MGHVTLFFLFLCFGGVITDTRKDRLVSTKLGSKISLVFNISSLAISNLFELKKNGSDLCKCRDRKLQGKQSKNTCEGFCESIKTGNVTFMLKVVKQSDQGTYCVCNTISSDSSVCVLLEVTNKTDNTLMQKNTVQPTAVNDTTNSTGVGDNSVFVVPILIVCIVVPIVVVGIVVMCVVKSKKNSPPLSPDRQMETENLNPPSSPQTNNNMDDAQVRYNARTQTLSMGSKDDFLQQVLVEP